MAATMNPAWLQRQSATGTDSREGQVQPANSPQLYGANRRTSASDVSRGSSGGGGGFTPRQPTGSVSTTTPIVPGGPAPTLETQEPIQLPALDEDLVKEETRKAVSAPLRSLRRSTREALTRHLDTQNPAIKRELFRAVLSGHGAALSQVFGGAQQTGRAAAERERQVQSQQSIMNFQAQQRANEMKFQASMQAYLSKFGRKTENESTFGSGSGSGGKGTRLVPTSVGAVSGMPLGFRRV